MHKIILYGTIFALTGTVAAAGAYLLAPAKIISESTESSNGKVNGNNNSSSTTSEDDFDDFVPAEQTPRDKLINNLASMKVLSGQGSFSLKYNAIDVSLDINSLYLTLETLNDVEASLNATLKYKERKIDIDITYAQGTIYLSTLGVDLKLATTDFSLITDMISSFNLPKIELPASLANLSMDSLMEKLGSMPYEKTDGGYKYSLELFEGSVVTFFSDDEYNFTSIKADNFKVDDLSLNLDATVEAKYVLDAPVVVPETITRKFTNFSDVLPLASHIAKLVKQEQFALTIAGDIKASGEEKGVTFSGATQFDLTAKSGLARLNLVEHEYEKEYSHEIGIDVSATDVIFNYNNSIRGKLNFASLKDIVELVQSLLGSKADGIPSSLEGALTLIEGTILSEVLKGNYEYLLDNVIKNLVITDSFVSLTIDKSFIGLDADIDLKIEYNKDVLLGLSISNIAVLGRSINLKLELATYDTSFETGINRNEIDSYSDYANFVPLVKGVKKLVEQKQFGVSLEGSFKKDNQEVGLTFDGYTQFDLDAKTGAGNISVVENESKYDVKPVHNINIDVDNQDVRFTYNDNLNGKFKIQTIKDVFTIVLELVESKDSRIYQWFGDTIENMNKTILMRIVNGEFALLFHNIIKSVEVTPENMDITVSGAIFNLTTDINVNIGFKNDNITSLSISNFEALGYTINLSASMKDYNISYAPVKSETEVNFYDLSDIKTLLCLGLNVANLDYFHITGTAKLDLIIDSLNWNLSDTLGIDKLPVDIEVFEDNGKVSIRGTLKGIPTVLGVNAHPDSSLGGIKQPDKSLDFYYKDGYMYLTRHDFAKKSMFHSYYEITDYCRASTQEFTDNIMEYLIGWGMGLNRSSLVWSKINGAIADHAERTSAMDYSNLFTDYSFNGNSSSSYGKYQWNIGLNIAELANNDQLKSCNLSLYGADKAFTDPQSNQEVIKEFLTHLSAALHIEANPIVVDISAELDLVDVDPYLTYEDLLTNSVTSTSYSSLLNYVSAHLGDSSLSF